MVGGFLRNEFTVQTKFRVLVTNLNLDWLNALIVSGEHGHASLISYGPRWLAGMCCDLISFA
jgi:hypothetical protein